jgi:predicted nuclease of predicted toxin-antitoxin system
MKPLFDQNLSAALASLLADVYPGSVHGRDVGLRDAGDSEIWDYEQLNCFTIVSKDSDFQQRSLLRGFPPKFIWLRVGNCRTKRIEDLLRKHSVANHTFEQDPIKSHLMLP